MRVAAQPVNGLPRDIVDKLNDRTLRARVYAYLRACASVM